MFLRILTIGWKTAPPPPVAPGRRGPAGTRYKANKGLFHVGAYVFPGGSAPPALHVVKTISRLTPVAGWLERCGTGVPTRWRGTLG